MTSFSFFPSGAPPELADDVRELFAELASTLPHQRRAYSGKYDPALDVRETDEAVEVVIDVAGVAAEAIRILFRNGVLLVAGEKAPPQSDGQQTFHLIEREFGRFVRAVRVAGAFDASKAHAGIDAGELVVVLPKVPERRGRAHRILVSAPGTGPA